MKACPFASSRVVPAAQRFAVAMLGARMHYAVPRILHNAGLLSRFYTDFDSRALLGPAVAELIRRRLGGGGRLNTRSSDLPLSSITTFSRFGLEYKYRLSRCRTQPDRIRTYLWGGQRFCGLVLESGLPPDSGVFVYNSAGLELLERARDQALPAVVEQTIAPFRVESQVVREEGDRFPNWESPWGWTDDHEAYAHREEAEWEAADMVLCGSQFVIDGIRQCGGPANKCRLIPYGYDVPTAHTMAAVALAKADAPSPHPHTPLRVLVTGSVCLRKGSPYVLEAARVLGTRAEVRMAGSILVAPQATAELRQHVALLDRVPREHMTDLYRWADVFLLPSLCEGSATAIYEALAHGLPVICTLNAGSVARDGIDGFVIPARDSNAIVQAVLRFVDEPDRWVSMAAAARSAGAIHSVDRYSTRILATLSPDRSPGHTVHEAEEP